MEALVLKEVYEHVARGERAALVFLEENKGSVPGKEGSIMGVFEDGSITGTVGGGAIEYDLVKRSVKALEEGENFFFDYSLTEDGQLAMACGGKTKGFVKIFYPKDKLVIFGAGHVAQRVAALASHLNFTTYVIDDREEFSQYPAFSKIEKYIAKVPEEAVKEIRFDSETSIVIMTRGHKDDMVAAMAVKDQPRRYLGMMGSKRKAIQVKKKLLEQGYTLKAINDMYLPIGIDISDGSIEEIAVSVLAELIQVKNRQELKNRRIKI